MIQLRKSSERGHADHGWLKTFHTFSFDDYMDPKHMGFRDLRVINEDYVTPGKGFPTHGHRDMEIVTYVLDGALEHKDSMGTGSIIRPGDVQYMSAGRGVRHSEFNHSKSEDVHLLQIWILPNVEGNAPKYDQKRFEPNEKRNRLRLIVSPDGTEGSIAIQQDARIYATLIEPDKEVTHALGEGRHAWLQVARGSIEVAGQTLKAGDGAAVSGEKSLTLRGKESAEVLVFDLA